MVAVDGSLRGVLVHAVREDLLQNAGVLQIGVGAAGDIGGLPPHADGEVGQRDPVPSEQDAVLGQVSAARQEKLLLDHAVQHLLA